MPKGFGKILTDHGAHIDARNKTGDTFESLIKPKKISEIANPLKYTTLACLAAKTIQQHNIKYNDTVPSALHDFIEMH
ncbi:Protein fem-1 homolog CG6966 [Eumeta japonica]|uniref:Protein fem-1 homolog CG6966 n=1 Tax=Eumeta variegata TaxID=151549 RepID=A0A4C1TED7_EUMVA|nr:Protein fem-1 homolog CG6966 [Eumeta japonica]